MQLSNVRRCGDSDGQAMLAIINLAAERYRGAIPDDCWHEPYMSADDLARDIAAGVEFRGIDADGRLSGIMGLQAVDDIALIRHAYVTPAAQGFGLGQALMRALCAESDAPMLVGTWAAADWAIRFYRRNGFDMANRDEATALLRRYWSVSDRQIDCSVVLRRS